MRYLLSRIVVVGWSLLITSAFFSASAAEPKPFSISAKATIVPLLEGLTYKATADLGRLPVGATGTVEIELINPFPRPVELNNVSKSCSCMEITGTNPEIPPLGSTVIKMRLETPSSHHSPEVKSQLTFHHSNQQAISFQLNVQYELAGLLDFVDSTAVLKTVPNSTVTRFDFPILMTEPLNWDIISIQVSPELEALRLVPAHLDGRPVLQGSIQNADVPDAGMGGTITIQHEKSGQTKKLFCIIGRRDSLMVSPRVCRFFRVPDSESENYEAMAFIRIDPETNPVDGTSPAKPIIDCTLLGVSLVANIDHFNKGTCRVKLRLSAKTYNELMEKLPDVAEPRELLWYVRTGQGDRYHSTRFLMPDGRQPTDTK